MTRVLYVDGPGPVTMNANDYDVVVFRASASVDLDQHIHHAEPSYEEILRNAFRAVVDLPQTRKISARQSWRDPWPGRRR